MNITENMRNWINNKLRNILNDLTVKLSKPKKLDVKDLPSLGLFYPDDFEIQIKKASLKDIDNYEMRFQKNILSVISEIKKVIEKNIILPEKYDINSIISIDIMYLFFEIVQYTLDKKIIVNINGDDINFSDNFHHFQIPIDYIDNYNNKSKSFDISGYHYTLPTIGIEKSVTDFLLQKQLKGMGKLYDKYSYNFMYFLGNKKELSNNEIDNLITIFNNDMEDDEKNVVNNIVQNFSGFLTYRVIYNNMAVPIDSNIDLEKIWEI